MTESVAQDINPTDDPLVFTDDAAAKVKSLIEEENNSGLMLRVFVTGGGCSGFQYGFTFDETINDGDTEVEKNGVKLLIDPMAVMYMFGTEMDYQVDKFSAQFVFNNPNQTSACGCGESVMLKPAGQPDPEPAHRRSQHQVVISG